MMKVVSLLLGLTAVNFCYADNQFSDKYIMVKNLNGFLQKKVTDVVDDQSASSLDELVKNSIHENELRFARIG